MKKNKLAIFGAVALCGTLAIGSTSLGGLHQLTKYSTIDTCDALREGSSARQLGGVSEGYMKICTCVSDGAASPAYHWCSKLFSATVVTETCVGGTSTVCP